MEHTEVTKLIVNNTVKYLAPVVKTYDSEFKNQLSKLDRIQWCIGGTEYALYLIVKPNNLKDFIDYFRDSKYYIDDYRLDGNHVLVFKCEDKNAYDKFLESRYSEMYSKEFIEANIPKKNIKGEPNSVYLVLTKAESYRKTFEEKLNGKYDTNITIEDDRELDFPINLSVEAIGFPF